MKRKLLFVAFAATFLLLAYTLLAWLLLRGTGAYRLNTGVGMILANSWQYTAAVSFVLVLMLGFWVIRHLRQKKTNVGDDIGKKQPTQPIYNEKTEKLPTDGTAVSLPATEKLAPATPMENLAKTELLSSAGTSPHMTEPITSAESELSVGETGDGISGDCRDAVTKTERFPISSLPSMDAAKRSGADETTKSCSNCGATLKPGQHFCTRCGTPVEGGE